LICCAGKGFVFWRSFGSISKPCMLLNYLSIFAISPPFLLEREPEVEADFRKAQWLLLPFPWFKIIEYALY
jgi:hypothetical protein